MEKKRLRSRSRSKATVKVKNQTPHHPDAETDIAVHGRETGDSVSAQSPNLMGFQFLAPCVEGLLSTREWCCRHKDV